MIVVYKPQQDSPIKYFRAIKEYKPTLNMAQLAIMCYPYSIEKNIDSYSFFLMPNHQNVKAILKTDILELNPNDCYIPN